MSIASTTNQRKAAQSRNARFSSPSPTTASGAKRKMEQSEPLATSRDSVTLGVADESSRNQRVLGNIAAGVGALAGRLGLVLGSAAAGATAGTVLGPVGAVVGGIVGLGSGAFVEFRDQTFKGLEIKGKRFPIGRMVGGMVGGTLGAAVGKVLDKLPFAKPKLGSEALNQEPKDFTLRKLAKNVGNVCHTSMPTMNEMGKTQEIVEVLRPGDILVTNNDLWMDFEIPLKLTGSKGDWTHTAIYDGEGTSIESLAKRGVTERPIETLIGENHHVRVLRPNYPEGGEQKAIDFARAQIGKPYDMKFALDDEKFYCIELTHRALEEGAPNTGLRPHKLLWNKLGPDVVTPKSFNQAIDGDQLEMVYDTGSNFTRNYLAKFS